MKIGQKSFIIFSSKFISSVLGFIATVYFARVLGAEILGYFAVSMALVSWLQLAGNAGVSSAVTKRISENKESAQHATAGLVFVLATGTSLSIIIIILEDIIENYVGASVALFLIAILMFRIFLNIFTSILNGNHKVHISGLLKSSKTILTKGAQYLLVVLGLELSGLLLGQIIGLGLILIATIYLSNLNIVWPNKEHFYSLWNYAKYSWVGGLKGRAFNNIDILILGLFVPSSLIGVYSVSWTISKFLSIFDGAISQTVFPEISYSKAEEDPQAVAGLVTEGVRYAGLITIPGVIGSHLLGRRLLQIYGPTFEQGTTVLVLLTLSILFYGYQKQILTGLNGIDRPDLAFRINIFFIISNIIMNVLFISSIGWIGGAIATALSSLSGLLLSTYILHNMIEFTIPFKEILKQLGSGLIMWMPVSLAVESEVTNTIFQHNVTMVAFIVITGASVYFLTLLVLSKHFRETVHRNINLK